MTKKDYELIAHILKTKRQEAEKDQLWPKLININDIIYAFADNLQYTQPRFNRSKFIKFCGIDE